MDKKQRRKYDTYPDIYMNSTGDGCFFRPHYPIEDSDFEAIAMPEDEADAYIEMRDM